MSKKALINKEVDPAHEFAALLKKMCRDDEVTEVDTARFRELAISNKDLWPCVTQAMGNIRTQLIDKISSNMSKALLLSEVSVLKKKLDYDDASHVERLLIDHVTTAWIRLVYAENLYTSTVVNKSLSLNVAQYWENYLTAVHGRYIRAVESLARVRKLIRNLPPIQINIASNGGQQVNVQQPNSAGTGQPVHDDGACHE